MPYKNSNQQFVKMLTVGALDLTTQFAITYFWGAQLICGEVKLSAEGGGFEGVY